MLVSTYLHFFINLNMLFVFKNNVIRGNSVTVKQVIGICSPLDFELLSVVETGWVGSVCI